MWRWTKYCSSELGTRFCCRAPGLGRQCKINQTGTHGCHGDPFALLLRMDFSFSLNHLPELWESGFPAPHPLLSATGNRLSIALISTQDLVRQCLKGKAQEVWWPSWDTCIEVRECPPLPRSCHSHLVALTLLVGSILLRTQFLACIHSLSFLRSPHLSDVRIAYGGFKSPGPHPCLLIHVSRA